MNRRVVIGLGCSLLLLLLPAGPLVAQAGGEGQEDAAESSAPQLQPQPPAEAGAATPPDGAPASAAPTAADAADAAVSPPPPPEPAASPDGADATSGVTADALSARSLPEADRGQGGGPVLDLPEEGVGVTAPDDGPGDDAAAAQQAADGTLIDRVQTGGGGVTLGGYGQHEFQVPEGQDPFFRNHRYIIFVFGRIHDRITTASEIEFEFAGSPLKKDGTMGPGEVLLEFSVLDFRVTDWLTLRAGVVLVPVGSFNINHDAPTRDLVDRPIAYTTVIPSTWFESGAGLIGTIPLGEVQQLSYELYAINGLDARIYDGFGLRAARGSHFEDNNGDIAFVGRLAWKPTLGLELGVSGYTGEYDTRENRVNIANLDLKLRLGPLELLGEVAYVKIDPGFVEGFSSSSVANTRDAVPTGMNGFYGQVNYHFTIAPLWRLLPADLQGATFTAAARYEGKDTDTEHHSAAGDQRRFTLGLNLRPVEQLVVKSDFQWNSHGDDEGRAPEIWSSDFWEGRDGEFLFDSYVASVAYLY